MLEERHMKLVTFQMRPSANLSLTARLSQEGKKTLNEMSARDIENIFVHSIDLADSIGHFTVVYSVTWPVNGNEAAGDFVLPVFTVTPSK